MYIVRVLYVHGCRCIYIIGDSYTYVSHIRILGDSCTCATCDSSTCAGAAEEEEDTLHYEEEVQEEMALLHVEVQEREVAKVEEKEEEKGEKEKETGEKEEEKEEKKGEKTCAAVPGGILQAALLAAAGATQLKALQPTATHCNALHRTATHCDTLQDTAAYCSSLQHFLQCTAAHCIILQHTATMYMYHSYEAVFSGFILQRCWLRLVRFLKF